ncbi:hypothetical protein BDW42DRAFT_161535 [Aspergillus taichungensis]|uniref:Uncharacterized protein n=1 Tax=Aspergillus taichungensis TaxID=482145 RepID=A0A2J5I539_9EURO|nr:hypothetical protein BDW42DRAFT_161535 [Aspergillus taichungensis]
MRFYSIIVATLALTVFPALAIPHLGEGECLDWCKDQRWPCPPASPPKKLDNGCWTCCRDMSYQWPQ